MLVEIDERKLRRELGRLIWHCLLGYGRLVFERVHSRAFLLNLQVLSRATIGEQIVAGHAETWYIFLSLQHHLHIVVGRCLELKD